jgi:hypothetical protein
VGDAAGLTTDSMATLVRTGAINDADAKKLQARAKEFMGGG